MLVSIVIRTLNEAQYLGELLQSISKQDVGNRFSVENVVIDSGSTDKTLAIARKYSCTITHIKREDFSFGRSLNQGCEAASGDILIFISGHCVPRDRQWLKALCDPIADQVVDYSYGKQISGPESKYSEGRIFEKYYPNHSAVPQQGFFCNNANSAISRAAWAKYRFDEDVTGLEDMELAQRLHCDGGHIGYVAEACVYHYHAENWAQVKRRFEREALALQKIMPQIHVSLIDAARYIVSSVWQDWCVAWREKVFHAKVQEIIRYRYCQYSGSYKGNHDHRRLSHAEKEKYFYPSLKIQEKRNHHDQTTHRSSAAHEG
jgi:glycosyltransferase involved in cell wall biosynthesis